MNSPSDPEDSMQAAQIAECRLDLAALRVQRDRYRVLGEHVADMRRAPGRLDVRFERSVDEALLTKTLAVERGCCPFFQLDYEPTSRWLSVRVEEEDQDRALEAIRVALAKADGSSGEDGR
jgi:hypothetical protein